MTREPEMVTMTSPGTDPAKPDAGEPPGAGPQVAPTGDTGGINELRDMVADVQARLTAMEEVVVATSKQMGFLPPQVRMLGSKLDGVATSLAEPRIRSALLSVLGIHDLIEQILRLQFKESPGTDLDHFRNYEVLRSQLRLILRSNGLEEIPTDGFFDPQIHRAVQSVPVNDPSSANRIVEVLRTGFRNELSVLRFAEVVVGRWVPAGPSGDDGSAEQAPENSPGALKEESSE